MALLNSWAVHGKPLRNEFAHRDHEPSPLSRSILTYVGSNFLICERSDPTHVRMLRGSWVASTSAGLRIGTLNRCASQRRAPERGSVTRSNVGSWNATNIPAHARKLNGEP